MQDTSGGAQSTGQGRAPVRPSSRWATDGCASTGWTKPAGSRFVTGDGAPHRDRERLPGWRVAMLIDGLDVEIVRFDGSPLRRLVLDPARDYQRIA